MDIAAIIVVALVALLLIKATSKILKTIAIIGLIFVMIFYVLPPFIL